MFFYQKDFVALIHESMGADFRNAFDFIQIRTLIESLHARRRRRFCRGIFELAVGEIFLRSEKILQLPPPHCFSKKVVGMGGGSGMQ